MPEDPDNLVEQQLQDMVEAPSMLRQSALPASCVTSTPKTLSL